jgi:hypothetical protein
MELNCCQCGKIIKETRILYQKRVWSGGGKFAGSYEYEEEFPVDAGVFCSEDCLVDYVLYPKPKQE